MKKKRVVILGGGISGLTAAYALRDKAEVILLEKEAHCGGVMTAFELDGFFFECGPRTFRTKQSPHLLQLCSQLGLTEQLIGSSPQAKHRYVLHQGHLQPLPSTLSAFFTSPLCRGVGRALLREWRQPRGTPDESIYTFAERRFGEAVASRFFDPFSLGIFGSDARQLSVKSCFPTLKEWENLYGSVTKGLMRSLFRHRTSLHLPAQLSKAPLFSFRQGTPTLLQALERQLAGLIRHQEEVIALDKGDNFVVRTTHGDYPADAIISTLPPPVIGKLLQKTAPELSAELLSIPMTSMTMVHLGYTDPVLPYSGFGYLIPTSEREKAMGVVFDSAIFPEASPNQQTRLTVMLHGLCGEKALDLAQDALCRHLGITQTPQVVHVREMRNALPVMQVGHSDKIGSIDTMLRCALPQLQLIGNYLGHPSVEACISRAHKILLH